MSRDETGIKRVLVLGAGRMGAWLVGSLRFDFEVAAYDVDVTKLKQLSECRLLLEPAEIARFEPNMVINAVTLHRAVKAFYDILPFLPDDCILSDIASVKAEVAQFYAEMGRRFVSTHPMFGPTFADVQDLEGQSAVIISQSDREGRDFFWRFFSEFKLGIHELTFVEHDRTIAYSLSIPFVSSMVFAACMKYQEAPGTTFKKHLDIAKGLLMEDDCLLAEILFNPHTGEQIRQIGEKLTELEKIVKNKETEHMKTFLARLKENISAM